MSSYLTFSPLPDPKIVGGVFSVALSVVAPAEADDAQALPGSAPNGARTFLERIVKQSDRDHPISDP